MQAGAGGACPRRPAVDEHGHAGTNGAAGGDYGKHQVQQRASWKVLLTYLHRIRGTRRGLSEAVRLAFGVEPEITESGGASWSARPLGPFPGTPRPHLHVHLRLPAPTPADQHRLDTLVAAARPAHMPYTVQVTATAPAERTPSP